MKLVTFKREEQKPSTGVIRGNFIIDLDRWLMFRIGDVQKRVREGETIRDEEILELVGRSAPTDWHVSSVGVTTPDFASLVGIILRAREGLKLIEQALTEPQETLVREGVLLSLTGATLIAPIPRPPKNIICLGRNYIEHAVESTRAWNEEIQTQRPEFPILFTKAPTSIIGPYDDIPYDPQISTEIDWEGELAVVIGKVGKNIRRDDAMQYVFGYTILNDVSARDIQRRHGHQYFKGKSLDGFCPMGPWIVTADEIPDPHNVEITVRVNGVVKQHDNARSMLFSIPEIIEQLSLGMTLEPGDIVATGTPSGVGFARTPPEFLRPGDVVECEIEKIGTIRNKVTQVG
jgi:2-keto-4-pentenoate hydratase/2-oxohepta-3-ene-1,7-dioic acid hydratase in catechol pathway